MSESLPTDRPPRRRRPSRNPWPRRALVAVTVLVIFAVGVALGQALDDGPPQPSTQTYVRTLEPVPQQPATTTG
jgi:hypothetical protein